MSGAHRRMAVPIASLIALASGILLPPVQAAIPPPKLQYAISRLPNGLTVIVSEDHSTPIVHVQVWYHVGSKTSGRDAPGLRTCSST